MADPSQEYERARLALNGLTELFCEAMEIIENDLFAQLCKITQKSKHSQIVLSFVSRKHGNDDMNTPKPVNPEWYSHNDSGRCPAGMFVFSPVRFISSAGSVALRWLDMRLDPNSETARLEKRSGTIWYS